MILEVIFEYPHTTWSPLIVFKKFLDFLEKEYPKYEIIYKNTKPSQRTNPGGKNSPHIMEIRNVENSKYILVSYWDNSIELTWTGNGWDYENCVEIITSSGVHTNQIVTPFSYVCYSSQFEDLSNHKRLSFEYKNSNELLFRGYLYGKRKIISEFFPNFFSDTRKSLSDYFDELNNSKICLSLDGAGEICNRDLEILCVGSVLLRPELKQKFHDPLIPDFHYLSAPKVDDPKEQFELLLEKYNKVKNNNILLDNISKNGLKWFLKNGSIQSNVDILKNIIKLNKLK